MATKIGNRTKSDRFRDILIADPAATVATASAKIGIGYAFAYGIARRTPDPENPGKSFAETRANRRAVRSVDTETEPGFVRVRTATGKIVRVEIATGAVTRPAR